jgi:hypothetical protein
MTTDTAITELLSAYKDPLDMLDLALLPSALGALFEIQQYRVGEASLGLDICTKIFASSPDISHVINSKPSKKTHLA